jgi:cytochrome b subunit of formate dehydrogenase
VEAGTAPPFGAAALRVSPHDDVGCTFCHSDVDDETFPHSEDLETVDCGKCHFVEQEQFDESLHGRAMARGDQLAPSCKHCHGTHDVRRTDDPESQTYVANVPGLCVRCHQEGSEVQLIYHIPQDSIFENYSQSIHGEGLYKKGLVATAVCTSCHTAHHVLPHTDTRSSIAHGNVAQTCMDCHIRIEEVHRQLIRGELWEKEPHKVPVCVDCHEPHRARKVFYTLGMSDNDCLSCHGDSDIEPETQPGSDSLFVDAAQLVASRHSEIACVQCHTGGDASERRPCRTMDEQVDCSICHEAVVQTYNRSTHGTLAARGSPDAPVCADCHGNHGIAGRLQTEASTYSQNIPELCGQCHRAGEKAAVRYEGGQTEIIAHYEESIHGRGLLESGLVVTATCVDCHTAHGELPHENPASTVHRENVAGTCAQCHRGIYELFVDSIHSPTVSETTEPLPTCSECHSAHTIRRTDVEDFKLTIMNQCGHCHEELTETYFETYHGKVSKLGYAKTAKCSDCHGAHDILPTWEPRSHLSRENIVETCAQCHPGSNRRFAGYLTHATHHEPTKYPALFWTFWGMTTLLVGTLFLAGLHTLAWLPRSLRYRAQLKSTHASESKFHYRRFPKLYRNLHIMVIVRFVGLAVTGMVLKFSYTGWAFWVARLLGGFESAGFIHRLCAVLTFAYFGIHIFDAIRRKTKSGVSWIEFIFGGNGMMFSLIDLKEFWQSVKWFFGKGPRPHYGRWTYWEKFDYFAVFWGVTVIGTTGLFLWFPTLFTTVLPGWLINVATIIHSDEALLATAFIFTIHFFNTHFRPEKFPMDTVIFTGGMPLEEFKQDRPREYEEIMKSGRMNDYLMPAPSPTRVKLWKIFGATALTIGIGLVLLILYSALFGYR